MTTLSSEKTSCWFAGHESFTLRHAWLPKAFTGIREQPDLFLREDAMVTLGVGKNMVRSIRHWALATGILAEGPFFEGTRSRMIESTPLGTLLFGKRGKDPYLEDPATLWLLHWHLASRRDGPTTWWWAFNEYQDTEFTKERMLAALQLHVGRCGWDRVAESSLSRDVDCFIRTYLPSRGTRSSILEDTLDCPFTELSLLHQLDDGVITFNRGEHPTLRSAVVAFSVLDYWDHTAPHKNTLTFDQVAYQPGSPGRVFRLSENVLTDHLEAMEKLTEKAVTYDVTAGLRQMYRRKAVDPIAILRRLYEEV
ncbi:MAG TPA: DUF4007 family protein [Tepidisphaeraceae bacterium]|nr:DUF4007 family protein [Tepidisphaeraceae bacterium]